MTKLRGGMMAWLVDGRVLVLLIVVAMMVEMMIVAMAPV